jgi:hypothetical protein
MFRSVKAFLSADLPIELIELLEKIIIELSPFSENKKVRTTMLARLPKSPLATASTRRP